MNNIIVVIFKLALIFVVGAYAYRSASPGRVIIDDEKDTKTELYTYTTWEDDNPSVLIAAAQTLANYHAVAVPHLADERDYMSHSNYLHSAINIIIAQIDKLNLNEVEESKKNILDLRDIIVALTSKLNEWPTIMVWSSAEIIKEEGPARIPDNKLLVHRGFDIAAFFLTEVIGDSLNWRKMPNKMDQLLFFEMYCKQFESVLQASKNADVQQCENVQYLETLRIEKNLFMLQAQASKAITYLEKALKASANPGDKNQTFYVQNGIKLIERIKEIQVGRLLNLAHKQRAYEMFDPNSSPEPETDL